MTDQLTEELADTQQVAKPALPATIRIPWAPVPKVNLLPIEIIENRRFRRTKLLLAATVVGVLLLAGAGTYLAQRSVSAANDQLVTAESRVSVLQAEQARYAAVPTALALVQAARTARTQAMGTDVLWYRYLNDIDGALPSGMKLAALSVVVGPSTTPGASADPLTAAGIGTVTLEGSADQYDQVSSLLETLDKITGFSSPVLTSASKADNKVTFSSGAVVDTDALSGRYNKKAG